MSIDLCLFENDETLVLTKLFVDFWWLEAWAKVILEFVANACVRAFTKGWLLLGRKIPMVLFVWPLSGTDFTTSFCFPNRRTMMLWKNNISITRIFKYLYLNCDRTLTVQFKAFYLVQLKAFYFAHLQVFYFVQLASFLFSSIGKPFI